MSCLPLEVVQAAREEAAPAARSAMANVPALPRFLVVTIHMPHYSTGASDGANSRFSFYLAIPADLYVRARMEADEPSAPSGTPHFCARARPTKAAGLAHVRLVHAHEPAIRARVIFPARLRFPACVPSPRSCDAHDRAPAQA